MKHFHEVNKDVVRGGSPTPQDIVALKQNGIHKIISLDEPSANKIKRSCQLLRMEHIIIPIETGKKQSYQHLLKHNIKELFDKPSFIHCKRGKDRTGLLCALYRCLIDGWDCRKALKEAKSLGFGTGMDAKIEKYCTRLIQSSCPHDHKEDENAAYDIVSNVSDQNREFRDYTLDYYEQQSFAPYGDETARMYPYDIVSRYYDEQYPNKEDYDLDSINVGKKNHQVPQVGIYDTNTMINGFGPSMVGSGFI